MQHLASSGSLADRLAEHLRMHRHGVGVSERNSWSRSLTVLANDLIDAGLDDVEMLLEYQLPLTSKRVDAVLAGVHPRTGADSYLVIELKQWSQASSYEGSETLLTVAHAPGPRLHPGVQVGDYCEYLRDFLGVLATQSSVIGGAAYLHNAADADVTDVFRRRVTDHSRIFTAQRRGEFLEYLRTALAPKSGAAAADRLLGSSVRPNNRLLAHAAEILRDRAHFTLLDEQRTAYELVLHAVQRARADDRKSVIVVSGGPGSGKSVIALSLLAELARQGRSVLHATGSRSFTQTLRKYAGHGTTRVQNLFKYFNNFMSAERNGIEVLVCDEAHRIRETSANRFTRREVRANARTQIDELLAAARVPVFLLDEHQVVRPGETGSVDVIAQNAKRLGLSVDVISLHDQFRSGGSEAYEKWVLGLLGIRGERASVWEGDGLVDVRLAGSLEQMEEFLAGKQEDSETARISAGYCWPWSDPRPDGTLVPDVQIGAWARPWNVKSDRSVGSAPGSSYWATDPNGFGQVGCVYTAQGFEYEWSGVILGPDLVARDGRLVTRRAESKDPALCRTKSVGDEDADRLIRNTYKVLLTRGMRGTIVYSTDAETREYLATLIRQRRGLETVYEMIGPGVYEGRPTGQTTGQRLGR